MSFVAVHFHEIIASVSGAGISVILPIGDILEKSIIGIIVGVGTWCITKAISWGIDKLKGKLK